VADRRYTKNGEWLLYEAGRCRIGLAASTVEELGDVTFVELPKIGRTVAAGEALCALEAVKAATDFYSPVDGTVIETNTRLGTEPELVNASPEDDAWICVLEGVSEEAVKGLLDEAEWKAWESGR
jgi:glycine cleavage system H protein